MGLGLDALTMDEAVAVIMTRLERSSGGYVMTPNLDNLRGVRRNPDLWEIAQQADLRVADGRPLVWASRLQGTPLPTRVAGSDLIFATSEAAAAAGRSVFLLGGSPGTAERAASELRRRYPSLIVAGTHCPPLGFETRPDEIVELTRELRTARPDIVLIGMPFPKAGDLVRSIRRDFPSTWFLGLGISFSFVCGDIQRAPHWMQRLGVEWLHRLVQEPRRLGRRYLLEGLPFALALMGHSLAARLRGSARRPTT
jgi:N-acetylglucosaminyldiphosphoundecaprenol N-acetyl-beta-D-mannosaminyltransferase